MNGSDKGLFAANSINGAFQGLQWAALEDKIEVESYSPSHLVFTCINFGSPVKTCLQDKQAPANI